MHPGVGAVEQALSKPCFSAGPLVRSSVIKTLIRQALNQQYLARGGRTSAKRR